MLYVLELYRMWLLERRRIMSHQTRVEKLIAETETYIGSHALEDMFGLRLERVREELNDIFLRGDAPARKGWRHWW
ncbi:MAG: hypothetical protein K2O56_06025 [Muribaculaceae bacterium]|nr:hypothetical protein [Muribaculaceae bacterium]